MSVQAEETFSFQAEAAQILDLMANSLYSNKEIFLRELISNSSDAIDRFRIERFAAPESAGKEPEDEPRIRVGFDKDAGTITIADNGIGVVEAGGDRQHRHDRPVGHRGVPARDVRRQARRHRADRPVRRRLLLGVHRRRPGDADHPARRAAGGRGVRWSSEGKGEYTVEAVERAERGTTIVLHLRDGEDELLNDYRLRTVIKRYSDHIG